MSKSPSSSPRPLDVSISAGRALGPFQIGMTLNAAIAYLSNEYETYKHVDFIYSEESPLVNDLVIRISSLGIQLRFHPHTQQLMAAEVFDFRALSLEYQGKVFSSPQGTATFDMVFHSIALTHGAHEMDKGRYVLQYPGLVFVFPVKESRHEVNLIKELKTPNAPNPPLSNIIVFHGDNYEAPKPPPLEMTRELGGNPFYFEEVELLSDGIIFHAQQKRISLGQTCQAVISLLGPPQEVFFKAEDKMRIHARKLDKKVRGADFFFNYFRLGIDLLFDAVTLTVKKVVVHTNYPGHFDFTRYTRCNFSLRLENPFKLTNAHIDGVLSSPLLSSSVISAQPGALETAGTFLRGLHAQGMDAADGLDESVNLLDTPTADVKAHASHHHGAVSTMLVTPETKWEDVQLFLGSSCGKPVIFARPPAPNASNPFGSTLFYSRDNIIFEVMSNDYIASVIICNQ